MTETEIEYQAIAILRGQATTATVLSYAAQNTVISATELITKFKSKMSRSRVYSSIYTLVKKGILTKQGRLYYVSDGAKKAVKKMETSCLYGAKTLIRFLAQKPSLGGANDRTDKRECSDSFPDKVLGAIKNLPFSTTRDLTEIFGDKDRLKKAITKLRASKKVLVHKTIQDGREVNFYVYNTPKFQNISGMYCCPHCESKINLDNMIALVKKGKLGPVQAKKWKVYRR